MPKSKPNRTVTLSKTKKKGREHKESIVNSIREAVEKYSSVYVFAFENMRNLKFKEFREQLKFSNRFFLGSNKVMQVSIGRSVADEVRPGLHKVSKLLRGDSGLCLTNLTKERFKGYLKNTKIMTLQGLEALQQKWAVEMELKEGPLDQFTHEMEPFLCKQGMPVRLNKGVILLYCVFCTSIYGLCRIYDGLGLCQAGVVELVSDFVVCEKGKPLLPESARILRLLGIKMATFRLHLICRWSPEEFEVYKEGLDDSDVESL